MLLKKLGYKAEFLAAYSYYSESTETSAAITVPITVAITNAITIENIRSLLINSFHEYIIIFSILIMGIVNNEFPINYNSVTSYIKFRLCFNLFVWNLGLTRLYALLKDHSDDMKREKKACFLLR